MTGQNSFQDRIARLEQKHAANNGRPVAEQPPSGTDLSANGPAHAERRRNDGGKGIGKFIFVTLFVIVALPAGAFYGTVFYQNNKAAFDQIGLGAQAVALIAGPGDAEQRAAMRKVDDYIAKLESGTMTPEEKAYWASDEGQAEFADIVSESINLEEIEALGQKMHESQQD